MYPGKVRMCNIFEPYDVLVPKNFYSKKNPERGLTTIAPGEARGNELQQSTGP